MFGNAVTFYQTLSATTPIQFAAALFVLNSLAWLADGLLSGYLAVFVIDRLDTRTAADPLSRG
jgi:hypothetical protein